MGDGVIWWASIARLVAFLRNPQLFGERHGAPFLVGEAPPFDNRAELLLDLQADDVASGFVVHHANVGCFLALSPCNSKILDTGRNSSLS